MANQMANHTVQLDIHQFRDTFLPALSRPTRLRSANRNPFSALKDAEDMIVPEISPLFVSVDPTFGE